MKEELRAIGLTEGEIKVYLALLQLGPSTNSPLARHTGLQSSSIYYCSNALIAKGFVSYIQRGNRRFFMATDPRHILSLMDEKAQEVTAQKRMIEKLLPRLKAMHQSFEGKTIAEVYDGFRGFQTVFQQILTTLKKGDTYEAFVIEQAFDEPKEVRLLFMRHNTALKKKGITLYLLAPEKMRVIFKSMYDPHFLKTYQQIRYTQDATPVGITIYKNNVVTHITEEGRPMSFLVRNPKLAEAYRTYFYAVWKKAKP